MFFKSLELRGFKSFVDETKIEFEPGITAIVGPNGCGKSNVIDAIRWALGEQSAKYMRGARMEDFIFNGSGQRKPTGLAEVSITFSNTSGSITSHPYADYEDIKITRKMYRTGESEYYINKVPCRLKDIVDVFLDTGVSSRSLSIIEQGQVERLINSKPEDRRFIIEEVAGVMKYKNRRHQALNKLAASQGNFLRIQDILSELERQRNSLNRQAKKAERFQTYRAELRSRSLLWHSSEYQRLTADLKIADDQLTEARERQTSVSANLSAGRNNLETLNIGIAKEEHELGGLKEELNKVLGRFDRNDHQRDFLSRQLTDMTRSNDNSTREIANLQEELSRVEKLLTERIGEKEALTAKHARSQTDADTTNEETINAKQSIESLLENQKQLTAKIGELTERIHRAANDISSINTRIEMENSRITSLERKKDEIAETQSRLDDALLELAEQNRQIDGKLDLGRGARDKIVDKLNQTRQKLKSIQETLRLAEDQFAWKSARLESLRELEMNMEGFGAGARNIMKLKSENAEALSGIGSLLIDTLRAPKELELALTAILGGLVDAVISQNSASTLSALRTLKLDNLGRGSFLSDDLAASLPVADYPVDHPELVGLASDLISVDGSAPKAISSLLEHCFITNDINGALDIWTENPGKFTVVTLEGDIIDRSGFVTGGGAKTNPGAGIVARKRMIEELTCQIDNLQKQKTELAGKIAAMEESETDKQQRLYDSEESLRSLEYSSIAIGKEIQGIKAQMERHKEQELALSNERENAVSGLTTMTENIEKLSQNMSRLAEEKEAFADTARGIDAKLESLRSELDQISRRAHENGVRLAKLTAGIDNLDLDLARLEKSGKDIGARLLREKESIRNFTQKREEMNESIETMLNENVELARRKDALTLSIGSISDRLNKSHEKRSQLSKDIKKIENDLDMARADLADLSMNKSGLELKLDNIIEKADHEFNIPSDDLESTDVSDVDMDEVSQRLEFLRKEVARIGDVNMAALEEYEEIQERYSFMKNQHDDLAQSISALNKTIENINNTTNVMFNDTYKIVARNFEQIFSRVFGGGRAEMRLVEMEGKPEPGLEIFVQPPGKRIQNLNLLSAGEKAMTSIALLFAVFMAKPSPFCILDEVDAPLDEANIVRFRDMLDEMKDKTQFIIITHNQKTMSFADKLYGVTQEQEGISKILAVNLVDHRPKPLTVTAA